jgi:hypothetical protein
VGRLPPEYALNHMALRGKNHRDWQTGDYFVCVKTPIPGVTKKTAFCAQRDVYVYYSSPIPQKYRSYTSAVRASCSRSNREAYRKHRKHRKHRKTAAASGRTLSTSEPLLAALAHNYNAILVTCNTKTTRCGIFEYSHSETRLPDASYIMLWKNYPDASSGSKPSCPRNSIWSK